MFSPRIAIDPQDRDASGRLRLTASEIVQDLKRQGLELREGLPLTLRVEGVDEQGKPAEKWVDASAHFNEAEQCWVAEADWLTLRHARTEEEQAAGSEVPSVRIPRRSGSLAQAFSVICLLLGFVAVGSAAAGAPFAPNGPHLIGTFTPAVLLLVGGLLLRQKASNPSPRLWVLFALGIPLALVAGFVPRLMLVKVHSEDDSTAWTYRSEKTGLSLLLPSREWEEIRKRGAAAAFHNPKRGVLVGVHVKQESKAAFLEESVKELSAYMDGSAEELLSKPERVEGTTEAGDPYVHWIAVAKAENGGAVLVGFGLVWRTDKAMAVQVMYEGLLKMRSAIGRAEERAYHEKTFKRIFLSVK